MLLDPIFAYVRYVLHVYEQLAPRPYDVPNCHVIAKGLKFLLPCAPPNLPLPRPCPRLFIINLLAYKFACDFVLMPPCKI